MAQVYPGNLQLREIKDSNYSGIGTGWAAHIKDLGELLHDVVHDIPNVRFIINTLDEPRVLIDPEILNTDGLENPAFNSDPLALRQLTVSCGSTWLKLELPSPDPSIHDHRLGFIQSRFNYNTQNPCQHPTLRDQHAILFLPATTSITHDVVPIVSQAVPLGFNDINYPPFWYINNYKEGAYKSEFDTLWETKTYTLYWAGSTTGTDTRSGA
jgi:hypothetical protein